MFSFHWRLTLVWNTPSNPIKRSWLACRFGKGHDLEFFKAFILEVVWKFLEYQHISRDPITEPERMLGVFNHLLSKVFRFHYYSQKVIGSLVYRYISIYIYIYACIVFLFTYVSVPLPLLVLFSGTLFCWPVFVVHPLQSTWRTGSLGRLWC